MSLDVPELVSVFFSEGSGSVSECVSEASGLVSEFVSEAASPFSVSAALSELVCDSVFSASASP